MKYGSTALLIMMILVSWIMYGIYLGLVVSIFSFALIFGVLFSFFSDNFKRQGISTFIIRVGLIVGAALGMLIYFITFPLLDSVTSLTLIAVLSFFLIICNMILETYGIEIWAYLVSDLTMRDRPSLRNR